MREQFRTNADFNSPAGVTKIQILRTGIQLSLAAGHPQRFHDTGKTIELWQDMGIHWRRVNAWHKSDLTGGYDAQGKELVKYPGAAWSVVYGYTAESKFVQRFGNAGSVAVNRGDVVIYRDRFQKDCIGVFRSNYSECPDRRSKYITVNCAKFALAWISTGGIILE